MFSNLVEEARLALEGGGSRSSKRHRDMATLRRTDPQAYQDVLYARVPGSAKKALRNMRAKRKLPG